MQQFDQHWTLKMPPLDNNEEDYELVMPFIVVKSVGGPFEDTDFVAGFQCGDLFRRMDHGENPIMATLYKSLIPQFDLIAMKHGYTIMIDDEFVNDLWVHIGFDKI